MKKFVSLLLSVVLLATMLSVFTLPASADAEEDYFTIEAGQTKVITGTEKHVSLTVEGILLVKADAVLTVTTFRLYPGAEVMLEPGATIKVNQNFTSDTHNKIYIPSRATVEIGGYFEVDGEMILEPGALLEGCSFNIKDSGKLTVCAGATVEVESIAGGNIDLYGALKSKEGTSLYSGFNTDHLNWHEGALLDLTFAFDFIAKDVAEKINATVDGNRVYKHTHTFNNACANCGTQPGSNTGSTLSEGNLTIIIGIAAFVLGLGVMFFIMKKKKPKNEIHNS